MSQSVLASEKAFEPVAEARPYGLVGLVISLVLILAVSLILTALVAAAAGGISVGVAAAKGDQATWREMIQRLAGMLAQMDADPSLRPRVGVVASLVVYAAITVTVLLAARWRGGRRWRDLIGWRPWHPIRGARLFWILTAVTIAYGFGADALVSQLYPPSRDWITLPTGTLWLVLFLGLAIVLGPITEEVLFRGWLYTSLRAKIGIWSAIIVSALLFALAHWENTHLYALIVFPVGLMLGIIREKTRSLIASTTLHAIFNGAASAALLFGQ